MDKLLIVNCVFSPQLVFILGRSKSNHIYIMDKLMTVNRFFSPQLVFILGRSRRNSTQLRVSSEASIHSDLIQEDFVESFRNLTLKSVFAVKWAAHFCPGASYFLKTDDDMFVNLPQMRQYLKTLRGTKLAAGTCGSGGERFSRRDFDLIRFDLI